jgi:hypothetical protein
MRRALDGRGSGRHQELQTLGFERRLEQRR